MKFTGTDLKVGGMLIGLLGCMTFPQLAQALYYDDAYGADGAADRCWSPAGWGQGYCRMPASKTWTVHVPTASAPAGCDLDTRAAILTAVQEWRYQLNTRAGHGWKVAYVEGAMPAVKDYVFSIGCSNEPATAKNVDLAQTAFNSACGGEIICSASSPWQIKRHKRVSRLTILQARIYQTSVFSTSTRRNEAYAAMSLTQRRTLITNLVLHELFHVAGLGHDTCAETPLMGAYVCGDAHRIIRTPSAFEIQVLQRYNPGTGTNPM